MSENTFSDSDLLWLINQKLELLIKVSLLNSNEKIKEIFDEKITELVNSPGKKEIWNLCDGFHTIKDITEKLNKKQPNISKYTTEWTKAGIVFEISVGITKYPLSIDSLVNYLISTIDWNVLK